MTTWLTKNHLDFHVLPISPKQNLFHFPFDQTPPNLFDQTPPTPPLLKGEAQLAMVLITTYNHKMFQVLNLRNENLEFDLNNKQTPWCKLSTLDIDQYSYLLRLGPPPKPLAKHWEEIIITYYGIP